MPAVRVDAKDDRTFYLTSELRALPVGTRVVYKGKPATFLGHSGRDTKIPYQLQFESGEIVFAGGIHIQPAPAAPAAPAPALPTASAADVRDTIRARLANIRRSLLGVGKTQTANVDKVAGRVVEANALEFERVLRINARSVDPNLGPVIDKFRRENVDLITSIPGQQLDQVSAVVEAAWEKGERVESLRAKLQERFDVSKSRADLIARDQVLKLNGQVTRERQKASGITEYVWVTSRDERVRDAHAELDGTRQRWDADPVTNEQGDTNPPGGDFQCRCVARPILSFLEDADGEE